MRTCTYALEICQLETEKEEEELFPQSRSQCSGMAKRRRKRARQRRRRRRPSMFFSPLSLILLFVFVGKCHRTNVINGRRSLFCDDDDDDENMEMTTTGRKKENKENCLVLDGSISFTPNEKVAYISRRRRRREMKWSLEEIVEPAPNPSSFFPFFSYPRAGAEKCRGF